jgi:DNA-binding GntR family transcriptional regulator
VLDHVTVVHNHARTMDQRTASAADQAYAYVRERVISGDFAAGTRLTEWQIADALGTSRTPVREAMRRLVSDGFLRFQRNYGTFVGSFTSREIGELFETRALLEAEVAAAAARHITEAQVEQLAALQEQIEARGLDLDRHNIARISPLNREFHRIISQASDSPRMVAMLTNAIEAPVVQQTFSRYTAAQLQRSFQHHRELVDAFRARDSAWARDAMSCHVRAARFAMLGPLPAA